MATIRQMFHAVAPPLAIRVWRRWRPRRTTDKPWLPTGTFAFRGRSLRLHPQAHDSFSYFCGRDPYSTAEMDCFLSLTSTKTRLLDIGALHGAFSLAFASNASKQAIAVDPSPLAFARLLYNLHANSTARVQPLECALSDHEGLLALHFEWEHAVSAPVAADEFNATCVTGDILCRQQGFIPDVIKIDVEGHEARVLRGLQATLSAHRPLLFLELHPALLRAEGDDLASIDAQLRRLGYLGRDVRSHKSLNDLTVLTGITRTVWQVK